ncbi:MAG: cation:proton antiporter [Dehalococcoidia bacterium]
MAHVDVLSYLLLDLVIIIIAARFFGAAARRVGQPPVIGEIIAGIMLGPTVLGRIGADIPGDIFPAEVPLRQIADLGLVFFMFLVGLELDPKLIRGQGRRAVQISLAGIVLPLAGGLLLGYALIDVNNEGKFFSEGEYVEAGETFEDGEVAEEAEAFEFALFLGAAMCITAFPVLARILVETGLYKTRVGAATLCAAAVDDVFAWIMLAAVIGLVNTGSVNDAFQALGLTAVFAVFMVTGGRFLLGLLAKYYDRTGRLTVDMVAIILAGVLASALATEEIGIHSIFGAFIFGAIMPKRAGITRELVDKVEDFTVIVLLPVFFLVAGLRTNLFTLDEVELVGYTALIVTVAIVGKFVGTGLTARLTGSSTRESIVLGSLMNTRGLTELVILSIGLSLGVLTDRTFAMMVIMALTTTFMAAPIVNRLMPREQFLKEIASAEEVPEMAPATRILVALGNPANAGSLVDAGIRLTGKRRPAELLLVRLIPTSRAPEFRSGLQEAESEIDRSIDSMRRLVEQAEAHGINARTISFLSDDVGSDLSLVAADQKCDAIVLGWHRASLERRIIRALVHRTFQLAPCDVVVLVDQVGMGIQPAVEPRVVAALSGGVHDEAVAQVAARVAENMEAELRLAGYLRSQNGHSTEASKDLALLADRVRQDSGLWVVPAYEEGDALAALVTETAGASVAVVGLGRFWSHHLDFGEPAASFAAAAGCPVLVVRAAGAAGEDAGAELAGVTPVGRP